MVIGTSSGLGATILLQTFIVSTSVVAFAEFGDYALTSSSFSKSYFASIAKFLRRIQRPTDTPDITSKTDRWLSLPHSAAGNCRGGQSWQ